VFLAGVEQSAGRQAQADAAVTALHPALTHKGLLPRANLKILACLTLGRHKPCQHTVGRGDQREPGHRRAEWARLGYSRAATIAPQLLSAFWRQLPQANRSVSQQIAQIRAYCVGQARRSELAKVLVRPSWGVEPGQTHEGVHWQEWARIQESE
jgi:hypothetical protein